MSRVIVFSGGSGVGKTSVMKLLRRNHPSAFWIVPGYTTRQLRADDTEYTHVSPRYFAALERGGAFLLAASLSSDEGEARYGRKRSDIDRALAGKRGSALLSITPDAVPPLLQHLREQGCPEALSLFYLQSPPDRVLRRRLSERGHSEGEIRARLALSKQWYREALHSGLLWVFIPGELTVLEMYRHVAWHLRLPGAFPDAALSACAENG